MSTVSERVPVGTLLRDWRRRRRLSQLELALDAGVSARHLSFVETGRSRASRELVLRLADQLELPLRDANRLLLAAGHAPEYGERRLDGPELEPLLATLQRVLDGHEPYPAVVVDRHWNLIAANAAIGLFTRLVAPELLAPPVNVLRASLHPEGLAPHVANLDEYRPHLLERLARQVALTADPDLAALHDELAAYPRAGEPQAPAAHGHAAELAVPLRLRLDGGELAFISTVATFGTAVDVTVAELAIEAFLPADSATAEALRQAGSSTTI